MTKTATSTLRTTCKKLGATIRHSRTAEWSEMCIAAPAGKRWTATTTHELVAQIRTFGTAAEDNDALAEFHAIDIRLGLEDCDDDDCECCQSDGLK